MRNIVELCFNYLTEKYSEDDITQIYDEEIINWVDYDQMNDENIEDEYEYYNEFGRGEAEDTIISNLIQEAKSKLELPITDLEYIALFQKIKEHYQTLNYI